MLTYNTPVENYRGAYGFMVKREDLSCPPPGPPFSKTRGVWAHLQKIDAPVIGVLDTYHSQAGHAVATACALLGKKVINYYPEYKKEPGWRGPQACSGELGADLVGLPAGPSWYLYHQAKAHLSAYADRYGVEVYMMPNALKLSEMVAETAEEVERTVGGWSENIPLPRLVIIPSSSATIAAGVMAGFRTALGERIVHDNMHFVVHMGYHRTVTAIQKGVKAKLGYLPSFAIIDEGYNYKDQAKPGETPPWPCNAYYDLKAFRWWLQEGRGMLGHHPTLFWNVG